MQKKIKLLFLKASLKFINLKLKLPGFLFPSKRTFIITILSFLLSTFIVYGATNQSSFQESNLNRFTNEQVKSTLRTLTQAVSLKNQNGQVGATGHIINLTGTVYESTDEISFTSYVDEVISHSGVSKVQAQTTGYNMLRPVIKLWKVSRDIALTFIVIVGFIVSLLIIFGLKQGQEFVTIMNAMPKFIVAVIMIIFSYSFAGLILDISTIGIKASLSVISSKNILNPLVTNVQSTYPRSIFTPSGSLVQLDNPDPTTSGSPQDKADWNIWRLASIFSNFKDWGTRTCDSSDPDDQPGGDNYIDDSLGCRLRVQDILAQPTNLSIMNAIIGLTNDKTAGTVAQFGIDFIFQVFILTIVIKIFFSLIGAFAQLFLRTISAPIEFLFIPIQGYGAIEKWIKSMLAQSLIFPITFIIFIIAAVIGNYTGAPFYIDGSITPSAISSAPLFLSHSVAYSSIDGTPNVNFLFKLIALVIVSQIPTIPKIIEQTLNVVSPFSNVTEETKAKFKESAARIPVFGGLASTFL